MKSTVVVVFVLSMCWVNVELMSVPIPGCSVGQPTCKFCRHGLVYYNDGQGCKQCKCQTKKTCNINGAVYPDGASFRIKCNNCICINGFPACTKITCPTKKKPKCKTRCRVCTNGKMYYTDANGCRKCKCKPEKKVCTMMDGKTYMNGESFKIDCNWCRCLNGGIACTKMACPKKVCTTMDGKTYMKGETFKIDCNTCFCGDNGSISCTLMGCPKSCFKNKVKYSDGQTFTLSGCTTCTCTNGVIVCTKKSCRPRPKPPCPKNYRRNTGTCPDCRCRLVVTQVSFTSGTTVLGGGVGGGTVGAIYRGGGGTAGGGGNGGSVWRRGGHRRGRGGGGGGKEIDDE